MKKVSIKKISIVSIVVIFIMTFMLVGCDKKSDEQNLVDDNNKKVQDQSNVIESTKYPLTITDSYDREITIDKEPEKIISIAPNITETIFSINAEDKLIARTDYCDYPSKVSDIQSIGSLQDPSIENIVELKPDLVIASTHFKEEVLNKLVDLDIKVAVLYGEDSFDGAYETVEKVGLVLNKNEEANKVIKGMKEKVKEITDKVKDEEKPSVYYVSFFSETDFYTAGGDTFINDMIEMAGGVNSASDANGWEYSYEKLIENDPEIIICSKYYDTKSNIEKSDIYKELTAVKKGNVFEIDNNLLDRQGPRTAEGLEALAQIIHPELFNK